jgi:hypothetical protein
MADEKGKIREYLERLFEWLSEWSFSSARGIPQNRDASSFLANIYMIPVDRILVGTVGRRRKGIDAQCSNHNPPEVLDHS